MNRQDSRMRKPFTRIGRDHCRLPGPKMNIDMDRVNAMARAQNAANYRIRNFDYTPRLAK